MYFCVITEDTEFIVLALPRYCLIYDAKATLHKLIIVKL
jgi:hypothetical protein